MNKLAVSGLLVFIVFLAGCAQGKPSVSGAGIIIKSFSPDLQTVDGGTVINFVLNIKNAGEKKAEEIVVQFFGLSDKWTEIKRDGTVITLGAQTSGTVTSLSPADATTGLPGEEASIIFEAKSPTGITSDVTYDANARVGYKYTTDGNAMVRVGHANYLRTNPTLQRGVTFSDSTEGPLSVSFFARSPVISDTNKNIRVQAEIQNVGDGRTYSDDDLTSLSGKLDKITIVKFLVMGTACAGAADTERALVSGKSLVISCDSPDIDTSTYKDITVNLELGYRYFVDSATKVTVLKALQ